MDGQKSDPAAPITLPILPPPTTQTGPVCLVIRHRNVCDDEAVLLRRRSAAALGGLTPSLTTRQFRRQIESLLVHFEPIDWPRLYAFTCGRASIPERCFLLTFDDGLADHARHVAPILQSFGIRGTFFMPGVVLMTHRLLSVHALQLLSTMLDVETIEAEVQSYIAPVHGGSTATPCATTGHATQQRTLSEGATDAARLQALLQSPLPPKIRDAAIKAVFESHIGSAARWARHWYISWDELAELHAQGHTIGGNGFSYEPLPQLTARERTIDLARTRAALDEGLGPDLRPFAYPFGVFDDDSAARCAAVGFVHAFTTEPRWTSRHERPFSLPRMDSLAVDALLAGWDRPKIAR
jgi:peptidoglycan/xylan/chitin deacetylase (PgdA/CDA1 family)